MAFDGSTWNENSPTNADLANEIDDYMRDIKIGVRSRMAIEHNWRASQSATGSDGYHSFMSLTTQTSQPGLVYGTATQAAAIYAISSGTGVSTVVRNSAGYEMTLGHSAYLGGGVIPKGGIIMWSGTIASIPFGWALCDGNNGTPNLVDKFVICAKQDDTVAKTNVTGSLTQTGGEVTHEITVSEMPLHGHPYRTYPGSAGDGNGGLAMGNGQARTNQVAFTGTPADPASEQIGGTGGSTAMSLLPVYYALAMIMKL